MIVDLKKQGKETRDIERKFPCFAIKKQAPYLETNASLKNKDRKNRKKANVYFQLKLRIFC